MNASRCVSVCSVIAQFYGHCTARVKELRRVMAALTDQSTATSRVPELLDAKSHIVSSFAFAVIRFRAVIKFYLF